MGPQSTVAVKLAGGAAVIILQMARRMAVDDSRTDARNHAQERVAVREPQPDSSDQDRAT